MEKICLHNFLLPHDFVEYREKLFHELQKYSYFRSTSPIRLSGGGESCRYVDGRQTTLTGKASALIGQLFLHLILRLACDIRAIGGPSVGADPLVSSTITVAGLTDHLVRDGFYIRKEPKKHGVTDLIVGGGRLKNGTRVALCDDVITSGESLFRAIQIAKNHKVGRVDRSFEVQLVLALVDREENNARVRLLAEVPKVVSLFRLSDFRYKECRPLRLPGVDI